jgi:hypothetical protein
MIQTRGSTILRAVLLAVWVLPCVARADDHEGTLVLKVDGKDVKLKLNAGLYGSGDGDQPDYFSIAGDHVALLGNFDLNGDGKTDAKDRLPLTEDEIVKPAKALNRAHPITPTGAAGAAEVESFVELPGLGKMQVLRGSTLTLTKFRVVDGIKDRWSGTVKLVLKGDKGQNTVTGTFDCGTGSE